VRKLLVLLVPVVAVALAALFSSTATSATRVKVGDNYFVRSSGVPTVRVSKGTRVKWVWRGRRTHNVTVVSGPVKFHSRTKSSGNYAKKVGRAGTYTIICTIHGGGDQKMKLVVS
jgi:plastocyanin